MATINSTALTTLALETWRASGARTEARRDSLITFFAESYFGPSGHWPEEIRAFVAESLRLARMRTRIDELKYT